MRNGIEAMITDITATTAEAEDYTGEDGLLYCGKCHTPKEAYFANNPAIRQTEPSCMFVQPVFSLNTPIPAYFIG